MLMQLISNIPALLGLPKSFTANVSLLFIANALNNATMFFANLIIIRYCSQEVYGVFSVSVNIALLTLTVSEFGMNYSMVRLYKEHELNPIKARLVLLSNLYFKLLILIVLALLSIPVSRLLALTLVHNSGEALTVYIALISGGFLGLLTYFRAFFQILSRFRSIAGLTILYGALRLSILSGIVFWLPNPQPFILLLCVHILPLIFVLSVCLAILRRNCQLIPESQGELITTGMEIIQYSKWVAMAGISFVLIQQSLIFIVSSIGGVKQAAILNAGLVFTAVFSLINDAVCQVLYPKIAGYSVDRLPEYRQRIIRYFPLFGLGIVIIMASLSVLMIYCLGEKYRESLSIFWITGLGSAITVCIGFYSIAIHTIKRPQIGAYVNISTLCVFLVIGTFLMKYIGTNAIVLAYAAILIIAEIIKAALVSHYTYNAYSRLA